MLFDVRKRSLRPADHSFRGFLPSVVCRSVIAKPRPWPIRRCRTMERIVRDKDPAVPDFVKRDAKYNSPDTPVVNVIHFCVWQGLPDRLNKSDLGDIESVGCGPLFPYLMTSSRLADYLRVHVPLSHHISRDSINIPLSCWLKENLWYHT